MKLLRVSGSADEFFLRDGRVALHCILFLYTVHLEGLGSKQYVT